MPYLPINTKSIKPLGFLYNICKWFDLFKSVTPTVAANIPCYFSHLGNFFFSDFFISISEDIFATFHPF